MTDIPQWKKDRCKWCAQNRSRYSGSYNRNFHSFGDGEDSEVCTAPTEAEYIAELHEAIWQMKMGTAGCEQLSGSPVEVLKQIELFHLDEWNAQSTRITELELLLKESEKDTERFDWWFGPVDKVNFLEEYLLGIAEKWDVGVWRSRIDAARQKEKADAEISK